MRICNYCKTEVLDSVMKCGKCGATDFANKCNKCGTIFNSSFCPTCGIQAGEQAKTCPKCGEKCFDLYCPKCGTDLSGRQNTGLNEYTNTVINISNEAFPIPPFTSRQIKKIKNRNLLLLLGLFFPIIVLVLIFGRTDMKKEINMVIKDGHPLYYGSIDEAIDFFRGKDQIKIMQKGDTEYTGNDTLVITSINPDSDTIGYISFDFSHLKDSEKYSVEDMLNVICDYIPVDIIEKYYDFDSSFMEESIDGNFVGYYYIMKLNNMGKALNSDIYEDTFAFRIVRDKHYNWEMEIGPASGQSIGYPMKDWDIGEIGSPDFNKKSNAMDKD